jgi:hypothetical protein
MDPFHSLLWETFMPRIRSAVVTWNSRHPDSLIQVNESDEPFLVVFGAFSGLFCPFEDLKVYFSTNFELLAIKIF